MLDMKRALLAVGVIGVTVALAVTYPWRRSFRPREPFHAGEPAPGRRLASGVDESPGQRERVDSTRGEAASPGRPEDGLCRVHIHDVSGFPIAGARVTTPERITTADESGKALFSWASRYEADHVLLLSEADGFVKQLVPVRVMSSSVRITMPPRCPLRGRVVLADGSPAPAGIVVASWAMGCAGPSKDVLVRLARLGQLSETPGLSLSMTDSGGAFALEELVESGSYLAVAGGLGFLSPGPVSIDCMEDDLELQVEAAYGSCVSVSAGGLPITAMDIGMASGVMRWGTNDQSLRPADGLFDMAALHGVAADECVGEGQLCLFLGPANLDPLAPLCWFEVKMPGYEPGRLQFAPARVGGALAHHQVDLELNAAGFGTLEVAVQGVSDDIVRANRTLAAFGSSAVQGTLELTSRAGGKSLLFYMKDAAFNSTIVIPRVPCGQYEWRLSLVRGIHRCGGDDLYAPDVFSMVDGESTRVVFDGSRLGGIEIVLSKGSECYRGPVVLALARGAPRISESGVELDDILVQRFGTAPYYFVGLMPGEYTARGVEPRWHSLSGEEALVTVSVESGRISRMNVEL